MRKKTIRIIALIVMLSMLLTTVVFASTNASAYIAATSAWITRDGNTVEVNFYIVGTSGTMDKIGVKYIYLYEKNGNAWNLVQSYAYTDSQYAATMMGNNTGIKAGYVTYSGSASKSYYADCRFYAEKGGGSDTIQQDTPTSYGTTP